MAKCTASPEVFSRVVGFYRPVKDWNLGKQAEFKDRKKFNLGEKGKCNNCAYILDCKPGECKEGYAA